MNKTDLWVKESPLYQGVNEEVTYSITTTPWGSSPSSPSAVVKDSDGTDVTTTVMPVGSASASGDVVTWPELKSLTADTWYTIFVTFTSGGNICVARCEVYGVG